MPKPFAVAMLLILAASHVRAESFVVDPPAGNWNKVQSLPRGTSLTIELKYQQEITGEFVRLDENAIWVKVSEKEQIYPKEAVSRVLLMQRGSRARYAAIWGGIMFGAGFGLGCALAPQIGDDDNMRSGERVKAGAGAGAMAAGIAALVALIRDPGVRTEVIYRTR